MSSRLNLARRPQPLLPRLLAAAEGTAGALIGVVRLPSRRLPIPPHSSSRLTRPRAIRPDAVPSPELSPPSTSPSLSPVAALPSVRVATLSLPSPPIALPLPSPFLSRCPSSVAFLSLRLSSPVALPLPSLSSPAALPSLPPPFLLSRCPSSPVAFLSRRPSFSPAALPSLPSPFAPVAFLSRCPSYSPVALPTLPSPFLLSRRLSLPSPFLLSRRPSSLLSPILSPAALPSSRRPSSLPSPFLSPVSYPLSRHPSSLPSPLPSRLPLFRRPSSLPPYHPPRRLRARPEMPARRPVIVGPSRFSLAALLSPSHMPSLFSSLLAAPSSPPSHHPRCPHSPPITLSLSPHITLLVAVALASNRPSSLPSHHPCHAAVAISSPTHHHPPHRLSARHKTPSRPPPTFSSHRLPRRLPSLPSHPVVPPLYPPIPSFFLSPLPSRCSSSLPSYPVVLPLSPPIPSFPLSPLLSRRPPCPQSLLFAVDQSTVPTPFLFSYIIHFFISIFFA
ncbi:unnamed protein product [Closterium sp. Naga37s-1]|nr:unnamed protein product [Closterium sp. Naga37s-1]